MTLKEAKSGHDAFDAVAQFADEHGHLWTVAAEFKHINGRLDIYAIKVWPDNVNVPLTRRVLRDLPLESLFRDALATEAQNLPKILRGRRPSTAHQGRPHSEAELILVAQIYDEAFQARMPVQKTVANALGISVSTAAKRILAARRQGYITTNKGEHQV
jgi:hypothetical protein